jgi:AraC-like DNA-binding protein
MDQDFMNRFLPKVFAVLIRDEAHWQENRYETARPVTQMCNLGFVLSGEGKLEINQVVYPLRRGSVYHITPIGSQMRFTSDQASPLIYIAIHFDYRLIQWDGVELLAKESRAALPMPHVLELDALTRAEEGFRQLHQIWNDKQPGYEWRARSLLIELIDSLESMQAPLTTAEQRTEESIRQAMLYVHEHYHNPVDREQIARSCSLSVSYFSLLFKKYTGYSYVQYIHKIRLEKAKMLLRTGSAPIGEIAGEIGYSDPLYFSKLFTREVGLSPREYRKG